MQMEKHDSARCPACGDPLWFGTKSEGSGWDVFYECASCSFERRVGRVSVEEIDSRGSIRERAAAMGEQF